MPELAKQIKVERTGADHAEISVDGKPFPWYLAEGGVRVEVETPPTVTLTLIAEDVQVSNSLPPQQKPGV